MGEVLEFYSGLTYSPKNVIKFGGTFVLRSSNVKDGEIIDADNVYVESNVVNCINVNVGDVIVVVRNGSRSLIGKHAQIKHEMTDTVIGAFMTGLRSSQSNFINALLDTPQFDIEITKNLGATINQITTGAFKQMNFCIPKLKEEQALIGTFFRTLDSLIAANQRKVDRLKQMRSAYLQQMFPHTGERVPRVRFDGFDEDWGVKKLGELLTEFSRKSNMEDEFPILSSTNKGMERRLGRVSSTSNIGYKIIENGNLVLSPQNLWLGNININDIGVGLVSPSYKTFTLNNIECAFIKPQLRTQKMLDKYKEVSPQGASVVRRNLEIESFEVIEIKLPCYEEQSSIGDFFQNLDGQISSQAKKIEQLKQLKIAYLRKMFI